MGGWGWGVGRGWVSAWGRESDCRDKWVIVDVSREGGRDCRLRRVLRRMSISDIMTSGEFVRLVRVRYDIVTS